MYIMRRYGLTSQIRAVVGVWKIKNKTKIKGR